MNAFGFDRAPEAQKKFYTMEGEFARARRLRDEE
jgi:hypothetical protein